ncbi:bifunctional protein bira [Plakobranchus ocellatus]|uniref:Bifunctional protein bira n=1 Tax=Plakobranchus ocellatus TaxID=259542 RepID=A0AAV4DBJ6_9GAST|nr:bifunctional protein bira [Plakobranchus ocellatus]
MGINVNSDVRRNQELSTIATSIKCERGGKPVHREKFFAEVCVALEDSLQQTRETNLEIMKCENLFKTFQDISVFCPSQGHVIDGKFLEIADNWEVRFSDKNNEEIFQGRSDQYTIRPKVVRKIIVVFTAVQPTYGGGDGGGKGGSEEGGGGDVEVSAGQKDWMKTCSLLVLPEPLVNPEHVASCLSSFLSQAGKILASGMGALFVAKTLHIPLKEILQQPSQAHPHTSLVYVQASLPIPPPDDAPLVSQSVKTDVQSDQTDISSGQSKDQLDAFAQLSLGSGIRPAELSSFPAQETHTIVFPCNQVCFQFFDNEKAMLAESQVSQPESQDKSVPQSVDSTTQAKDASELLTCLSGKTKIWATFSNTEDTSNPSVAACTVKPSTPVDSSVALVGFDLGADYAITQPLTTHIQNEMERVNEDRFKRDVFLQQIVDSLV